MKRSYFFSSITLFSVLCIALSGCTFTDTASPTVSGEYASDPSASGDSYAGGGSADGDNQQAYAGRVTAGEWRDLDNWLFWSELMTAQADDSVNAYSNYADYWQLYTNNRVAVRVFDEAGVTLTDAKVQLVKRAENGEETVIWTARTDNMGFANLWIGVEQFEDVPNEASLQIVINDIAQLQPVRITHFGESVVLNEFTCDMQLERKVVDIAFIVDATGSMADEIRFLQADMKSIISSVESKYAHLNIRTGAVFYRDEGDDYLTRVSQFTDNLNSTSKFINKQSASGGGDYPEAVHTALEVGLQKLSWSEDGAIRLVFMLLDAPPHHNEQVLESLHISIPRYAEKGIRIIPIASSGIDKNTEFFLRFKSILTDATYVFITNDSGIGNDHIQATVGEYKVELLNELILRLIEQYIN